MPGYAYAILVAGWLTWVAPFLLTLRGLARPKSLDRRARWGILLVAVAYSILWQGRFWERQPSTARVVTSTAFFLLAAILSWTATTSLGRQWRIDAGLNPDHELVMTGPYRLVRHPIYTSMLCALLGTGLMIAPLPMLLLSTLLFTIGTEVRVRIEDGLLASRFGDQFRDYQRSVSAYIPFLK